MRNREHDGFWKDAAAVAAGILLAAGFRKTFLWAALPFLIAYVGARTVRPAGRLLARLMKLPERAFLGVWSILMCAGIGYVLAALSGRLIGQLLEVARQLPAYAESLIGTAESLRERLGEHLPFLAGSGRFGSVAEAALSEAASTLGGAVIGWAGEAAGHFPSFGIALAVTAVGFCYLVTDPDGAEAGMRALLGTVLHGEGAQTVIRWFRGVSDAIFLLLRAYGFLTFLTFGELFAGFLILGTENPLAGAFLLALLDALPLFGCGAVLIPWGVVSLLSGKARRGVGLLILSAAVWLIRQALEPRLIGRFSGAHPLIALLALTVGYRLCGVPGMVLTPLCLYCVMQSRERAE